MNFSSTDDVKKRLTRMERLTPEEMNEAIGHVQFLLPDSLHRYFAELLAMVARDLVSLKAAMDANLEAIHEFDRTSRKLTTWLIVLTGVLVVLTGAITWFTIVLAARH